MRFDREIHEQYQKAYALARKYMEDKKKQRLPVCPAALNTLLDEKMISYRLDLGILEIPLNLVIGASEENENTLLYTKEFLPVSLPNSTYADTWRGLYLDMATDNRFHDEILCFEYLGKFYVCDGMKRVSVAKFAGNTLIKAHVIRIIPARTDEKEVVLYFDFLAEYRLTQMYQLQFTQAGYFDKLQVALGRKPSSRWSDRDREYFLQYWPAIESAFNKSYENSLRISAADALVVLLGKFSFEQIASMESWMLARVFQAFWKDLYALSFPAADNVRPESCVAVLQSA